MSDTTAAGSAPAEDPPWPEPPRLNIRPEVRFATVRGDAEGALSGEARGGDQTIQPDPALYVPNGPSDLYFAAYGDADELHDSAAGGDDTVTASAAQVGLIGDARFILDDAAGGDDVLGSMGALVLLVGDAAALWGEASGGDDTLQGSNGPNARRGATNELYGDGGALMGSARAGHDVLRGGGDYPGSLNLLYGDAFTLGESALGGDDTLVGGQYARNEMWGDAAVVAEGASRGRDVFVVGPSSGITIIHDFEPGRDRIDLSGFAPRGIRSLEDLLSLAESEPEAFRVVFAILGSPDVSPGRTEISLKVFGYDAPRAEDFIFGA